LLPAVSLSYFKTKLHQIRFRLGLCPRPRWESLQCSPDPLAGYKGPTSRGREGRKDGRKGQGEGVRQERGRVVKGEGKVSPPNIKTKLRPWAYHTSACTISSAIAERLCDAQSVANLRCSINARRISFEKLCNRRMTPKVIDNSTIQ